MGTRPRPRVPRATYRLQFNGEFTLASGTAILGYLRELGISDCYASPLFKAGRHSTHGYDVCGFGEISPALGGVSAFNHFTCALREFGLGLLLDMVPNHMGASPENEWWVDVLEHGRASAYAAWFDIDWQPLNPGLRDRILLPVLEDHYFKVLESGKLRFVLEDGAFGLAYYDRRFPLAAGSYRALLQRVVKAAGVSPAAAPWVAELNHLGEALDRWEPAQREARAGFAKLKQRLRNLCREAPALRAAAEAALAPLNGRAGEPHSFDGLHSLLQQQHYRLAYWRVTRELLNYRRFFDVTELVSLRMELPEVFQATHHMLLGWLREGKVTGLRIDHPDGLWDPKAYLERLQEARRTDEPMAEGTRYVLVEKILVGNESLPSDWPVAGTTGYDFLNRLNGLFVDSQNESEFTSRYADFTDCQEDFRQIVYAGKKKVLFGWLLSELNSLTHHLRRICAGTRYGQDFSGEQLRAALSAVIAAFPVYRTYAQESATSLDARNREYCRQAIQTAKQHEPALETAIFDFIQDLLLLRVPDDLDEEGRGRCREFVMRFQQLTGPVMAKGVEDTAFYNYNRLVSLNEVGGDPSSFGTNVETFHRQMLEQARAWPHTLLATATHDTKRGEDLRARLNVLSEIPQQWSEAVQRWSRLNAAYRRTIDGEAAPHPNDEYLLYQTLVGAWPCEPVLSGGLAALGNRVSAYMLKAIREAKARTNWTEPNTAYEKATQGFVAQILDPATSNSFLADFKPFQQRVAYFGCFNSLSQVLLKMTAPGVPDFYQGTELWDFNLVDPDNRRPVDYEVRHRLLADLQKRAPAETPTAPEVLRELLERSHTGQVKLFLIWRTLQYRKEHNELFEQGTYLPLTAFGPKQEHVCAFARQAGGRQTVVIAPRLVCGLAGGVKRAPMGAEIWVDTLVSLPEAKPGERFRNVLTGEVLSVPAGSGGLPLSAVLALFPVALLEKLGPRLSRGAIREDKASNPR